MNFKLVQQQNKQAGNSKELNKNKTTTKKRFLLDMLVNILISNRFPQNNDEALLLALIHTTQDLHIFVFARSEALKLWGVKSLYEGRKKMAKNLNE